MYVFGDVLVMRNLFYVSIVPASVDDGSAPDSDHDDDCYTATATISAKKMPHDIDCGTIMPLCF